MRQDMKKPVILTGLRANNDLTLGNYFGGILPMIDMAKTRSDEFQLNMFIPDLHSFTTPIDHSKLYDQILQTAKLFVAAGLPLDNANIYLYRQSYIPAHSELTWILDNFTGVGHMNRMTQFKDKSVGKDDVSVGLFNYPVLMAADILLYGAKYVPVGDDQSQHLEFTRDIAERMNTRFGELFVVPQPVKKQHEFFGNDQGLRIMDLVDPTKKMSKSDELGKGVIFLNDKPETAAKKVMSATTDDKAFVAFDPLEQPGISNLLQIHALLSGEPLETVIEHHAGQESYGEFKKEVAEQVKGFLTEFQLKLAEVNEQAVFKKLEESERAMNEQANETLYKVQQAVGLRPKA
jgi:tryptophanyl-tRNA synthetase